MVMMHIHMNAWIPKEHNALDLRQKVSLLLTGKLF